MNKRTIAGIILLVSLLMVFPFILLLIESTIFDENWSNRRYSLLGQLVVMLGRDD